MPARGYNGFSWRRILGWDPHCAAPEDWIVNMRVDDLPNGRNQAFYHVL